MVTTTVLLALTALSAQDPVVPHDGARAGPGIRPRVEVWTNRGDDVVSRGDRVRVFLRADRDAFVTVFRVDTDGRVRVLFPREPWEDTFLRREREYEIEGPRGRDALTIDDYPGVGYIFAVAAADPFDYRTVVTGDHWDYRVIADGRVRGDPYVALTDLAQRIVPEGYEDWDYDLAQYYVERHYDYPRFVCYDCHSYASWTYWDPYRYDCRSFRIVIYDDPWYYPYRYYGGTRVVWIRPYRPQPRYVFKEWSGVNREREEFITRARQRPAGEDRERERTARPARRTGVDAIPAPRTRDRDQRPNQPEARPDRPAPADRPADRPVRPVRPVRPDPGDRPATRDKPAVRAPAERTDRSVRPVRPAPEARPATRDKPAVRAPAERTDRSTRAPAERTDRSVRPAPGSRGAPIGSARPPGERDRPAARPVPSARHRRRARRRPAGPAAPRAPAAGRPPPPGPSPS